MIDRDAYDKAGMALDCADDVIEILQKLKTGLDNYYAAGLPVGGMCDALSDCIGSIELEKMECEETRKDYHNASNKLSVG